MHQEPKAFNRTFILGGTSIAAGHRNRLELPVARLPAGTFITLPIEVVHGTYAGPKLWISAAVHGDELNGIEIARQVLAKLNPQKLHGTVVVAPMVNGFGVINQSRYLPDRRDLNRCFPGSKTGSLASRLAYLLMTEVVQRCEYGIDLHTAAHPRTNLPQVRGNMHDQRTLNCAQAFNAPVLLHATHRDGSLRAAATRKGITVLLYEAGEPQRFNDEAIKTGVNGILRVLAYLGMRKSSIKPPRRKPEVVHETTWLRAKRSGITRLKIELGSLVTEGQVLAEISDVFGEETKPVLAPFSGIIIGLTTNPLVHQGDSVIHLARRD